MHNLRFVLLIVLCLFFGSCSMNYDDAKLAEQLDKNIPSTIIKKAVFSKVENGYLASRIKAEEIRSFKNKNESEIYGANFSEYNEAGEVIAQGSADLMHYHFQTEDAELEGNIRCSSKRDNIGIEAESLKWKKKEKHLSSNENDLVTIKSQASTIRGKGFSADAGKKSFSFTGPVSGYYEDEDETDEELQDTELENKDEMQSKVNAEEGPDTKGKNKPKTLKEALQEVKETIEKEIEKNIKAKEKEQGQDAANKNAQ